MIPKTRNKLGEDDFPVTRGQHHRNWVFRLSTQNGLREVRSALVRFSLFAMLTTRFRILCGPGQYS